MGDFKKRQEKNLKRQISSIQIYDIPFILKPSNGKKWTENYFKSN